MKKRVVISAMILTLFLLAGIATMVVAQSNQPLEAAVDWFWGPTTSVVQIDSGCCDESVVVIEGWITSQTNASWNEWEFYDPTGNITLDFEDEIPSIAILRTNTVRIIGKVNNNLGNRKIDVYGEETIGSIAATANTTVAQVNAGNMKDQEVAITGKFGNKLPNPQGWEWMWFNFSDNTGTTTADLENDLTVNQVPQNLELLYYGKVGDYYGQPKVDARLMLLYHNGTPTTPLPTTPPPTTPPPTTPPPSETAPPPTKTPLPPGTKLAFLPWVSNNASKPPDPTLPPSGWVWGSPTAISVINSACCDQEVVVIEGKIGPRIDIAWNEYDFSDSSGNIVLDFEDEIPDAAIPQGVIVRMIGKSLIGQKGNTNYRKIDVFGLQTLGNVSVQGNVTAQQVNSGSLNGQEVAMQGQFGSQNMAQPQWNWYNFSDTTGTTLGDLENDLTDSQIPKGQSLLLFGNVNDYYGQYHKINARLMLFAANIQ